MRSYLHITTEYNDTAASHFSSLNRASQRDHSFRFRRDIFSGQRLKAISERLVSHISADYDHDYRGRTLAQPMLCETQPSTSGWNLEGYAHAQVHPFLWHPRQTSFSCSFKRDNVLVADNISLVSVHIRSRVITVEGPRGMLLPLVFLCYGLHSPPLIKPIFEYTRQARQGYLPLGCLFLSSQQEHH